MNRKLIFFITIVLIASSISYLLLRQPRQLNSRKLRKKARLRKVVPPKNGIYHGAFPDFGGNEDKVTRKKIKDFESLTGKKIAWAYFSNNWGRKIRFPKKVVKEIRKTGAVPFIRMMPRSNMESESKTKYTLQRIIDGRFDKDLRKWARDAKKIRTALMVDFGVEVNGDWFPWSGAHNGGGRKRGFGSKKRADGPERFQAAYRHIVKVFRSQKVRNISWVFHVDSSNNPEASWNKMRAYYPGDKYIDWLGISAYGSQNIGEDWVTFDRAMDEAYKEFRSISKKKPLALLEFGVAEDPGNGDKAVWIRDALNSLKSGKYKRIKAISYWHEKWINDDGKLSNLRLDSSPEALQAYKDIINDQYFRTRPIIRSR